MTRCEQATTAGQSASPMATQSAEQVALHEQTAAFIAKHKGLPQLSGREVCQQRWVLYRGDENYGLGNILYDVASAAAIAMILNRSLIYGRDPNDRKFNALLEWPGLPTLEDVELRRSRCGTGALATQTKVPLSPDRCRAKHGHGAVIGP